MSPDDYKSEITDVSAARKSISVVVPADKVAAEYDSACRKYTKNLKVPGFRQGKVPPHIIRQRFGREIEQETIEHVIEHALEKVVSGANLRPLRPPVLKEYKHAHGEALTFTAEFEVKPHVSVQGARDIKVKLAEPAVTDRMVADALETMRERAARFDPIEGRGIQPGDFAVADIKGRFLDGGGADFSRENILIEIGSGGPNPELTDPMRGMTAGETREFTVSYPGEHPSPDLAGHQLGYTAAVREIKTKVLPELDDDFARDLGKFESFEELRHRVEADLMDRERRKAREAARQAAIEQLLSSNPDVPVPDVLVDEEVDRRIDDLARTMILQGMDPRRAPVDWDDIREKQREPSVKNVRAMILLDAVAEEQKISLEPEALDRALSEEAARRRQTPEALRAKLAKDGRLKGLEEQLLREKVLDFLLAASNT